MSKPVQLDQMKLFCDIGAAISKQHKKIPSDNRSNAIIKAANMIVKAYSMSNAEFVEKYGNIGQRL